MDARSEFSRKVFPRYGVKVSRLRLGHLRINIKINKSLRDRLFEKTLDPGIQSVSIVWTLEPKLHVYSLDTDKC